MSRIGPVIAKEVIDSINCPYNMILEARQGPLYFDVAGEGPPLVFVSGWAMSSECWRPVVEILAPRHRCVVYDSRGIARSQPVPVNAAFGIEDLAEDLHALILTTGAYDATLIGHETGALVAALCARRHPQDASSLIAVSPRFTIADSDLRKLAVVTPASLALREIAAYPVLRNLVAWRFRRAPQPYRRTLFDDFAGLNPRAAYETALSVANLDPADQMETLVARLRLPILAVCGDRDKKGVEQARLLFSKLSAGRLATLSDCGFLPMLEYPDQFARLVESFVRVGQREMRNSLQPGTTREDRPNVDGERSGNDDPDGR